LTNHNRIYGLKLTTSIVNRSLWLLHTITYRVAELAQQPINLLFFYKLGVVNLKPVSD